MIFGPKIYNLMRAKLAKIGINSFAKNYSRHQCCQLYTSKFDSFARLVFDNSLRNPGMQDLSLKRRVSGYHVKYRTGKLPAPAKSVSFCQVNIKYRIFKLCLGNIIIPGDYLEGHLISRQVQNHLCQ